MMNRIGLLLALLWSGLGYAQPELRYRANLAITAESVELEAPIGVDFEIDGVTEGSCLYVPAHDQNLRDILLLESLKAGSPQETAGRQDLSFQWTDMGGIEHIGPALYRLPPNSKELKLKYMLSLGGWRDRPMAPRLLTLWHPILLKSCPDSSDQTFASLWPKAKIDVHVATPNGWQFAAPGEVQEEHWSYEGSSFSAVFFKQGNVGRYKIGNQTLLSVSKSKSFDQLIEVTKNAMDTFEKYTGTTPEPTLLLVETDDFEPVRTPGMVTLNTPQQPGMRYLQQEFTHWNVWQLTTLIAQQWFGMGCRAASVDDHWLVQGLADMLVYSMLSNDKKYFDLFSKAPDGKPYLNLNYRQAQDLAAASLSLLHPQTALMNSEGVSNHATQDRPFIAYIRNTHILRYLQWKLGNREFQRFLVAVSRQCSEESLQPRVLSALADSYRPGLGVLMNRYWQSDDWPEAGLDGTFVRDGKTFARVHYDNDLLLPVDLWVTTKEGSKLVSFVEPVSRDVEVPLEVSEKDIVKIEINPSRAMFDKDRFNNKTGAPKIAFFPGAARGLEDDAYTIAWLPYPTQLPGEPFTLNLSFQTMAYLNSGITGGVRYQPETDVTGFSLVYMKAIPESSLTVIAKIGQDDGHVEDGERRMDVTVKRKPIFSILPRMSGSARVRSKQMLGQADSLHYTTGFNVGSSSESGRACGHEEEIETEGTAYVPSGDFLYLRSFARVSAGCETRKIGFKIRGFYGSSRAEGNVPRTALFRIQNLDEAHVRLDKPSLAGSLRMASFNIEASTPASLPLPESWFVLPRRSQFKLFFDAAKTMDPDHRVSVSGVGYSLPIGGDVAGKETVTLLKFSLNGIFYRKIDEKVNSKPGLLFDFSGAL
jgi:hypothetical protein